MNTKANHTNNSWKRFNWLLAALAVALTVSARSETGPAAIPFSDIGARATANYQGDALGIMATADGARLRCGFQKLEGHATPEGLWLESTKPGAAGRLRLVAVTVGRDGSRALPCAPTQAASFFDMPLLTELETTFSDVPCYRHAAPNGAIASPGSGTQTLARTGKVSVDDKLVRFTRPGLTEEYSVSVDGVRQDFVIAAPPAGAGELRVELALSEARAETAAAGARLTLEGSGRTLAYSRLRVEDAAGRELLARLAVVSTDRLLVTVADANATYPVRIDPTFSDANWVSLGSGMNGGVYALAVSGTNLYVGGGFSTAGGVPANLIAKWDGSAWSALGSGLGGPSVEALAVSGTDLYAGGTFTSAGGVAANLIAKWNGSAWSALGSGMGGNGQYGETYVTALAVSGPNLYAGGSFTTAGGIPANNMAKWNGSAWSALSSGMGGSSYTPVFALAVSGTDLYAGGYFTTAGGAAANNIAKWDGSAWSALGSGITGPPPGGSSVAVNALVVSGTNLYAGGAFTTAGGVTANSIAKWNGSAWSALGSGMYAYGVSALAVSGTDLYAGGQFNTAGGVPANNIAKWDGSAWSALGSGINAYGVSALAADWAGRLFVGGTFSLAGTNVSPNIAQANLSSGPTVLMPPQTQTAGVGATGEFQVQVSGTPPLAYQWFFNATNVVSGGTNAILQLTDLQLSQSGAYSVVVSNAYGSVTSSPALLTVTAAPHIVSPPTNQKTLIAGTAGFSVLAVGTLPLVYQWFFSTDAILGATNSTLQLTNVQPWQAGGYTVVVTNAYGAATSAPAVLEVFPPSTVLTPSEAALRAALAVGGTVTFACDGTITLTSTITNNVDLTLDSTGYQVTISGGGAVRVFLVNTNVNFTLASLTIANANSRGGSAILNLGGTVELTGVTFSGNTATIFVSNDDLVPQGSGGAIFNRGGTVKASNCSFVGNAAQPGSALGSWAHEQAYGGAIRNESGEVDLRSCVFASNRASGGAGVSGGSAIGDPAFGGAVHNSGTMTLDLCTLTGNSATGGSGLGNLRGYPGNSANEGSGGSIFNQGTLTVDRTTLCGNTATGGAGGQGGTAPTGGSTENGFAGGNGGGANGAAICNQGSLWIARSTFASNVVTGGVGGQGGWGITSADMGGNGASGGNGSSGLGGALFNSGAASLVNCTIAFNTGAGGAGGAGGGGASNRYGGSGGAGGSGGSGFGGVDGTCNLTNCTLAWNRGNSGPGGTGGAAGLAVYPGVPGPNGTDGAAWGGTACGPLVNTLIASNTPAGGDSFSDPKLGPLADNGGPTLTMALLPGSPAIDAGNTSLAPATDQRGFPRPAGLAADIGAFEFGSMMPTVAVSRSGATGLNILASGNAGQSCRLLSSTNLSSWVPLATNQIGATERFYSTSTALLVAPAGFTAW